MFNQGVSSRNVGQLREEITPCKISQKYLKGVFVSYLSDMVYFVASNLNLDEQYMSLNNAPKHIKLAVDLIESLEASQVDDKTVVAALELVLKDYLAKLEVSKKIKTDL